MGMLVTGSIIKPRIFISTSIATLPASLHHIQLDTLLSPTSEFGPARVTRTRQVLAQQAISAVSGMREIQSRDSATSARSTGPAPRCRPSTSTSSTAADQLRVAPDLDGALLFLQDHEPPRLLFFGDLVVHRQRRRVRPRRILEAEQRVVLHFVQQVQRLPRNPLRSRRESRR